MRRETRNAFERIYLYSSDGIIGYEEDGEKFLYRKNLFGDIIAIYKGLVKVAEYTYDAWGNCTITYDPDGYGASNPIRYRGYYWDSDIKMYYLVTRYYDPKIGRFINADTPNYLNPNTVNGLNLYAYCGNNPIMCIDPSGHEPLSIIMLMTLEYLVPVLLLSLVGVAAILIAYNTKKAEGNKAENVKTENNKTDHKIPINDNSPISDDKSIFNDTKKDTSIVTEQDLVFFTQGFHWLVSHMNFHGGPGFNVTVNMFDTDYFSWLDFK